MQKRLQSLQKMSLKKLQGFTLIELMIAMALIAILATAGIQAYTGYLKKSRDTARAQIASNLNSSVMAYAASNGGNPPADQGAFDSFLASAGEVFSGSGVTGTTLVEDPVGGKDVCLDALGEATQPCSFNYTAYDDGTYAISYGVEHESSREGNFYKTTDSVLDSDSTDIITATIVPKYGVYVGSAKYVGQPATTQNVQPNYTYTPGVDDNDGVDETYTPPGASAPVALVPVFRSIRVDTPTAPSGGGVVGGGGGLADGQPCTNGSECENEYCASEWDTYNGGWTYECTDGGVGDVCTNNEECAAGNCYKLIWICGYNPYECYEQENQSGTCQNPGYTPPVIANGDTGCYSGPGINQRCAGGHCATRIITDMAYTICTDGSNGSACAYNADCVSNHCSQRVDGICVR